MRDVMIDIEVSACNPNVGGIFQIGAVKFDLASGQVGETFKIACIFLKIVIGVKKLVNFGVLDSVFIMR